MTEITIGIIEEADEEEPRYNSGVREYIVFDVIDGDVVICFVDTMDPVDDRLGTTSCEYDNGCLDYMVTQLMSENPRDGFYIMEDTFAEYSTDYWGETDVELMGGPIKPASWRQIVATGIPINWRIIRDQVCVHIAYRLGLEL